MSWSATARWRKVAYLTFEKRHRVTLAFELSLRGASHAYGCPDRIMGTRPLRVSGAGVSSQPLTHAAIADATGIAYQD